MSGLWPAREMEVLVGPKTVSELSLKGGEEIEPRNALPVLFEGDDELREAEAGDEGNNVSEAAMARVRETCAALASPIEIAFSGVD